MPRLDASASRKRRRWLLIPLALLALPVLLKALGAKPVNRAATSLDSADASLRTRFYEAAPAQVRLQVLEATASLSTYGQKWLRKSEAPSEGGGFVIACEVRVLIFTDDLAITIAPHKGGSRVDVTSASRVGRGDFGENARHIRQVLGALDARLAPSRAENRPA